MTEESHVSICCGENTAAKQEEEPLKGVFRSEMVYNTKEVLQLPSVQEEDKGTYIIPPSMFATSISTEKMGQPLV